MTQKRPRPKGRRRFDFLIIISNLKSNLLEIRTTPSNLRSLFKRKQMAWSANVLMFFVQLAIFKNVFPVWQTALIPSEATDEAAASGGCQITTEGVHFAP